MSLSSILPITGAILSLQVGWQWCSWWVSAPILPGEAEQAEAKLLYVCFGDFAKLKFDRVYLSHCADLTIGLNGK